MEQIGRIFVLVITAFVACFHTAVVGYVAWNSVFVVPYFPIGTLTYAQCLAGVFIIGLAKMGIVKYDENSPAEHIQRAITSALAAWIFIGVGTLALLIVG